MKHSLLETFNNEKVVAVIRTDTFEEAESICRSIINEGLSVIEVTMTVPNAPLLIRKLKEEFNEKVTVGAGTILSEEDLRLCHENLAEFAVMPFMDEKIIEIGKELKIPVIPGGMTVTEILSIKNQGLELAKLFPANVQGISFLKAVKSIIPDMRIMPTGGVSTENMSEWINAGAECVGIGSDLVKIYRSKGNSGLKEYCKTIKQIRNAL